MHRFHATTAHSELLICAILYTQKSLLTLHGTSGAGTNLKAGEGGTGLVQNWEESTGKWEAPVRRCAGKIFLVVPLHFFGSKSTIIRFGERFHDGQYSLVSFLFAVPLLTVPPAPGHL